MGICVAEAAAAVSCPVAVQADVRAVQRPCLHTAAGQAKVAWRYEAAMVATGLFDYRAQQVIGAGITANVRNFRKRPSARAGS